MRRITLMLLIPFAFFSQKSLGDSVQAAPSNLNFGSSGGTGTTSATIWGTSPYQRYSLVSSKPNWVSVSTSDTKVDSNTWRTTIRVTANKNDTGYRVGNVSISWHYGGTVYASATFRVTQDAKSFTLSLDKRGGSGGSDTVNVTYGSAMPTITPPTFAGSVFSGYWAKKDGVETQYYTGQGTSARNWDISDQAELYAIWTQDGYSFYIEDGGATVTGMTNPNGEAVIPLSLGGHPVSCIGANAFSGCSGITSVVIPDSIEEIGDAAFSGCSGLSSITIPDSVTSIGNDTLSGCTRLQTVFIPLPLIGYANRLRSGNSAEVFAGGNPAPYMAFVDGLPSGQVGKRYNATIATTSYNSSCNLNDGGILPDGLMLSLDGWLSGVPRTAGTFSFTVTASDGGTATFTLTIHPPGYDWLTSGIWKYEVENDEVIIRRCTQTTGPVTVPETIDGYPVRAIEAQYAADFDEYGAMTNIFIPAVVFESGITAIQLPSNLRNLGTGAVTASEISSLNIPSGVTNIGYYAATLCRSLQSVQIGPGVRSIKDAAFTDCSALRTITIPNTVRELGIAIFERCSRLETATVQANCRIVPASTFLHCGLLSSVTIPASATNVQSLAFGGCVSLENITIPDSVEELGVGCFLACSKLKSFACPQNLQNITESCFSLCSSLSAIDFNDALRVISTNAFSQCAFQEVVVPDGIVFLGPGAFSGCTNLVSISLPFVGIATNYPTATEWSGFGAIFGAEPYDGGVETMQVFDEEGDFAATWYLPESLKTVEFRGDSLAPGAFSGCGTLESVSMTGSPTHMPDFAFFGCEGMDSFVIPESVKGMGFGAFGACSSLQSIHLPVSPESVGEATFWQCTNLTEVTWGETGCLRMEEPGTGWLGLDGLFELEEETCLVWTVSTENPRDWIEWLVSDTGERRATGPTAGIRLSDTRSFLVRVTDMSMTAADTAILRFRDTASAPWIVTEDESAKGGFCLRSGAIPASTNSTIEAMISGKRGTLSFKWRISAGRGDFCKFFLDGLEQASITRSTDWATVTLDIPAGQHTFRWAYERGSGAASGEDAAFLDAVDWKPELSFSVASEYGVATPAKGTHTLVYGDDVSASVVEPAVVNGTRRVCTGWTGTGSVPATGLADSVSFTITNDSSIVWSWRKDHWIDVSVSGGTVDFVPQWIADGTQVAIEIVPATHLHTISLSGDTQGATLDGTMLRFVADGPRNICVSVEEVKVSLAVESEWGIPSPTNGVHDLSWGTRIEASIAAPEPTNGIRHVCLGWTGIGSVPSSGTGTNATFVLETDSSIRWNWQTNVWLSLATSGMVSVDFVEAWGNQGTNIVVNWSPTVAYYTVHLSGDTDGVVIDASARTLTIPADKPRNVSLSVTRLTLASALDAQGLVWTTDGEVPWYPQVEESTDGEDAVKSGIVSDGNSVSAIQTTVTGPGTFAWSWRLAAAGNSGVDVMLDGRWLDSYEPHSDWRHETLAIEDEGEHTVRFEFWNAGTAATRGDCAYLDQVSWTGVTEVTVDGWFDVNFADPGYKSGFNWSDVSQVTNPGGTWELKDCFSYIAGASGNQERRVELNGTTGIVYRATHSSETGADIRIEGRVRITIGDALVPTFGNPAGLTFLNLDESGAAPYGVVDGNWVKLRSPAQPLLDNSWHDYALELDHRSEQAPRIRYSLDGEALAPAVGGDAWIPLANAPAGIGRVLYRGNGAIGNFRGLQTKVVVPIADVEIPNLVGEGGLSFGTDGSGNPTFNVRVANPVPGVYYTAFVADTLDDQFVADAASRLAESDEETILFAIADDADRPSRFVRIVASTTPFAAGDPLPAEAGK